MWMLKSTHWSHSIEGGGVYFENGYNYYFQSLGNFRLWYYSVWVSNWLEATCFTPGKLFPLYEHVSVNPVWTQAKYAAILTRESVSVVKLYTLSLPHTFLTLTITIHKTLTLAHANSCKFAFVRPCWSVSHVTKKVLPGSSLSIASCKL